ncbi:MAG: DNA polymerase III subunit chi [Hyphomicrobiaceae bacterium]
MTEVLFYHLQSRQLEHVLPSLLEKTLARGWRAVVQSLTEEFLESVDALLWSYSDESFLPHGTARDGQSADQPVYLTTDDVNPNGATVRFMIEGAEATDLDSYERIVVLFDGRSDDALETARAFWRKAKTAGCEATYWQENDHGGWKRRS